MQSIEMNKNELKMKNEDYDIFRKNNYYKRIKIVKRIVSHIVLILFSIFSVFPIYYVFITSLNPIGSLGDATLRDLLPTASSSLSNYYDILFRHPFLLWLRNTLLLTATSTLIGLVVAIISGLAFSRFKIPAKHALLYTLLILTLFPFTMLVIPFYFMFAQLHLLNTFIGLIIPYSAFALIYATYLIKTYVDNIPKDYEEAAQMDGLSRRGALFRILVPMAKPVIIFSLIVAFMGPYTDYALAGQFLTSSNKFTMAIGMYYISQGTITINYGAYSAFAVLMGIPIFIVFFVFQKYLVSGFSLSTYK
ncbi:MAG: ABC transporter permease subunit [Candidatus Thermoplasmatota archaeon]|jgi:arabinogalactan oligomer/maltooligosaccharide transport system permease protein|nr:ABC transporter permease subunit [Candidatus Thermoplasmatota archaeon]MCL5790704.1 ABC transporter permease subunit [Candidatus Thermoplasmatota archaeon]